MGVHRLGQAEQLLQQSLARGARQQVRAAHDVGDVLGRIVRNVDVLVGNEERQVAELRVFFDEYRQDGSGGVESAGGFWLGLTLLTAATGLPHAAAQTPDADPAAAERTRTDDVVRFRVRVDAPPDIAAAMASSVDLIRWQDETIMLHSVWP